MDGRALKVQAGFPGSVLFTQDSPGVRNFSSFLWPKSDERTQHTSTSAPSLCTINHFRQYFVNGTLPAPGTVCPVDVTLFGAPVNSTSKRASLSADDERVLAALKVIGDSVRPAIMRGKQNQLL
jgi:hypothetical protein